jgi:hypothetical protein
VRWRIVLEFLLVVLAAGMLMKGFFLLLGLPSLPR